MAGIATIPAAGGEATGACEGMVCVPGGTFRMGSDHHYPEEAPVHRVNVNAFWIDRTPVTNRQFKEFVRVTGELAPAVRDRMRELFEAMKAEAMPAGDELIARETALDRAFTDRTISPEILAVLTARIGESQARLRAIHLKYHLTTADFLSPHQRHRYAELRGYR